MIENMFLIEDNNGWRQNKTADKTKKRRNVGNNALANEGANSSREKKKKRTQPNQTNIPNIIRNALLRVARINFIEIVDYSEKKNEANIQCWKGNWSVDTESALAMAWVSIQIPSHTIPFDIWITKCHCTKIESLSHVIGIELQPLVVCCIVQCVCMFFCLPFLVCMCVCVHVFDSFVRLCQTTECCFSGSHSHSLPPKIKNCE